MTVELMSFAYDITNHLGLKMLPAVVKRQSKHHLRSRTSVRLNAAK